MRIVIMGTGPFAVPTCQRMMRDGHDIPLVVTRPLADPLAKKRPPRPVYEWAQQQGLAIFEPPSINSKEVLEVLAKLAADLFFVCDYGQILSNECLTLARLGGINLHGSILPRHRGAAPVQWSLLRGDNETGVTVIHMTPRLDAGPTLAVARTEIRADETAEELEPRLSELGVETTVQAIQLLEQWDGSSPVGELQDKSLVTKAPRFSKADGQLDFRLPAEYLVRLVRACQPWPGTYADLAWPDGKLLRTIVRSARAIELGKGGKLGKGVRTQKCEAPEGPFRLLSPDPFSQPEGPFRLLSPDPFSQLKHELPGGALSVSAKELGFDWPDPWQQMIAVHTPNSVFLIGRVQPAGKRIMSAEELLRGHPLPPGCKFLLPEPPKERLDS